MFTLYVYVLSPTAYSHGNSEANSQLWIVAWKNKIASDQWGANQVNEENNHERDVRATYNDATLVGMLFTARFDKTWGAWFGKAVLLELGTC